MIKLEDEEVLSIIEQAQRSYKRHYYSARGQQITISDGLDAHIVWATLDYLEKKSNLEHDYVEDSNVDGC